MLYTSRHVQPIYTCSCRRPRLDLTVCILNRNCVHANLCFVLVENDAVERELRGKRRG